MWLAAISLLPLPIQVAVLWVMYRRKQHVLYPVFWMFLWFELCNAITLTILHRDTRSLAYFIAYWGSDFVGSVFVLVVLREVFVKLLEGYTSVSVLRRRGYEVALAAASFIAIFAAAQSSGAAFYSQRIIQVQQAASSIAITMLVFVVAASAVLGIRWRSHLCGIAAALGVQGIADALVFAETLRRHRYTPRTIGWIGATIYACSFLIMGLYFLLPQEEASAPQVNPGAMRWIEEMSETVPQ